MRKKLACICLLISILFFSYPFFVHYKQTKEIKELQDALIPIQKEEADLQVSHSELDELIETVWLEIPSIELNQPVLAEMTENNLNRALSQIKKNQQVGTGNFTIAGHLSTVENRFFNRLPDVQLADELWLSNNEKKCIYKVTSIDIIEQSDVFVLEDDEKKVEITLITCTPDGKERLAVKGVLIRTETIES